MHSSLWIAPWTHLRRACPETMYNWNQGHCDILCGQLDDFNILPILRWTKYVIWWLWGAINVSVVWDRVRVLSFLNVPFYIITSKQENVVIVTGKKTNKKMWCGTFSLGYTFTLPFVLSLFANLSYTSLEYIDFESTYDHNKNDYFHSLLAVLMITFTASL